MASAPIETERKRGQLVGNVRSLVDKFCAIFDWDVPDIDRAAADKLILAEIRKALDTIERSLAGCDTRRSGDGRRSRTGCRHGPFIRRGLNELAQSAASEMLL